MNNYDAYFMSTALEEAEKAYEINEVPIGAVIVKDGEIVSRAYNMKEKLKDATAHAEILAIKDAGIKLGSWRLTDCTLYVTIEPCPMCAGAIIQSRLDRLVFGAFDEKAWGSLDSSDILANEDLNHRVEVVSGVMKSESSSLMKKFFQSLR